MTMHNENTQPEGTPTDLRAIERLLDRLGAYERGCSPFGMEDRLVLGVGVIGPHLDALAAAEMQEAGAGLEDRVYERSLPILLEAGALLQAAPTPEGLEERIFQATRGMVRGNATAAVEPSVGQLRESNVSVLARIGIWSARLAAVLALGAGVWLAFSSFRTEAPTHGLTPRPVIVAAAEADDDLSFDEFDEVLESHLAFMRTVEYRPIDVDVLDEDWCTPCELIEIEAEISS